MAQDLSFSAYTARQFHELEQGQLISRASEVRPSGNYRYEDGQWIPNPYPGFAVITMVSDHPRNASLPEALTEVQRDLVSSCPWEGSLYLLPPSSFHQTIANTLSASRFLEHIYNPGLEPDFPGWVGEAFKGIAGDARAIAGDANGIARTDMGTMGARGGFVMNLIGLSIFGTALGALGVFENQSAYQKILRFREGLYGDEVMGGLDIKCTRPFIGHVSLAYVAQELTPTQKRALGASVYQINQDHFRTPLSFYLDQTGLKRYEHLSEFKTAPSYPSYYF